MMQNLDLWFALAVLVYVGAIAAMWRFWHPRDPISRRAERAAGDFPRSGQPEQPYLLENEVLVQRAPASYYVNRADTQWVSGAAPLAGAGWVAGFRRNRSGYAFQESGALWLTNRRLVFIGPCMSINLPLGDILQVRSDDKWLTVWTTQDAPARRWRLQDAELWRGTLITQLTGGPQQAV
ncbi:MAG: hypothetical protein H7338_17475 [Candidatus Sericytochromatia bacterium]|nr:hypothetical protein [Candidatus Sericytochromatia bacterium]